MLRTTPIRVITSVVAAAALLTASACGGDDDGGSGGGSTEDFCAEFATLAESDTDAALDPNALQNVADAAPSEISGAMDRFVEIVTELDAFDEENASEEDLEGFFSMLGDLEESSTEIEAFLVDNCPDLPPGLISGE